MEQNDAGLTAKQEAAITALLTEPSQEQAAKKAGVSRSSLRRWLASEDFQSAYKRAKSESLEAVLTALQGAAIKAVMTLRDVMDDVDAKPSERVSAAKAVLDNLLRSREQLEIEDRLRTLEQQLGGNNEKPNSWTH
jgi:transcriptional regulator with XRE-family HTH domain